MIEIKTISENTPKVEAMDHEKVAIALEDGSIVVVYLDSNKIISCSLEENPVQIALYGSRIYVLTKPYPIEIKDDEENEELLGINMFAQKKTGVTLWLLEIENDKLVVVNRRDKTGGFGIYNDKIYACDPIQEGFYALDPNLNLIERVEIKIKPTNRKPWYSSIYIFDGILYLIQEDDMIRWFNIGVSITEGGILSTENLHASDYISINNPVERMVKVGSYVVGVLASPPFLIHIQNNIPHLVSDPNECINLKYKESFSMTKNLRVNTGKYAIANNRFIISIADTNLKKIEYAFSVEDSSETLNISSRFLAYENYLLCFAWTTHDKKCPIIIFDMTELSNPKIKMIVNFRGDVNNLAVKKEDI
ncbi:hypothetical protein P3G55_07370 [Leptospira sp. 96542]|nr:hypothetical protein [Leptospira sp. 96542]